MVVKDLSKQKALDVDRRAIRQINYTANLDTAWNITMIFNTEEAKEHVLDFPQEIVKLF